MSINQVIEKSGLSTRYSSKGMSIGGQWVEATDGKSFDVYNPATGETWSNVPDAGREDAAAAIAAAAAAQPAWAAMPFDKRAILLNRVAEVLERRKDDFINALTAEGGGWIRKSMFEINYAPSVYRAAAAAAYSPMGEALPSDHLKVSLIDRKPLGVISVISPWNVPLLLSSRGIGVALAMGNTVVLKPSEETPVTGGLMLAEVFEKAGVPAGVLNVVTCSRDRVAEVGDEMVVNPLVKAISFTGSTAVGKSIARTAGGLLKKACVELGGKDSLIVLDDADLERAVSAARFGSYFHQGQICMSTEKILVDRKLGDEFLTRFIAATMELNVGDPTEMSNQIGPIINQRQVEAVEKRLADALEQGAVLEHGGGRDGLYFKPTVITGVRPDMEIFHEEVFGPVANIMFFDDEEHALSLANNCNYGLSASVITRDEARGLRVARQIESGMAHVNDATIYDEPTIPFGGVKNSGMGRHGGQASIDAFTQTRWLTIERGGRKTPF